LYSSASHDQHCHGEYEDKAKREACHQPTTQWYKEKDEDGNQKPPDGEKYSDGVGKYGNTTAGEVMDATICSLSTLVLRFQNRLRTSLVKVLALA
jgi:hypothetical protein